MVILETHSQQSPFLDSNKNSSAIHSGKGRNSEKLPKDLETFVQAEFLIASHYRDLFRQSLCDDLTIEGIRVPERQIEKRVFLAIGSYIDRHNENPKPFIGTARASDILEKVKRARRVLHKRQSA